MSQNRSKYIIGGVKAPITLTPRRLELVELVVKGFDNEDIARIMGTTRYTVRMQLARIYKLTGTYNRIELYTWYLKNIKKCQHC